MPRGMGPLKGGQWPSDAGVMAKDLICPICSGDLLLSGDEDSGDDIFCPTCQSPCVLSIDEEGETKVAAAF